MTQCCYLPHQCRISTSWHLSTNKCCEGTLTAISSLPLCSPKDYIVIHHTSAVYQPLSCYPVPAGPTKECFSIPSMKHKGNKPYLQILPCSTCSGKALCIKLILPSTTVCLNKHNYKRNRTLCQTDLLLYILPFFISFMNKPFFLFLTLVVCKSFLYS